MSHHCLHFDGVRYRYPDGHEALRGVRLHIAHGEKVALVGANGAGKSTLLLLTAGLLLPSAGEATIGGIRLTSRTLPRIRQTVGLVFQQPDNQLFMPTVEEDVAFGPANMGLTSEEIERRVAAALEAVGAPHLRKRSPYRLSGGEKRSAAIATVLAMQPSVLALDEPTSDLDPRARRQTIELLRRFDHTMLVATHDMEMVVELCPRTVILRDGATAADGPTADLFRDTALLDACALEQPCSMRTECGTAFRPFRNTENEE